jgi:hypothetical protein
MTEYVIVPATPDHARDLAPHMRFDDRREIWAASRATPLRALMSSLRESAWAFTGLVDGVPVCMFGVVQVGLFGPHGVPWLLASPEMEQHAIAFLRRNRAVVAKMSSEYDRLVNYVDARNTTSIKWLRWLKFDIMSTVPYGPFGLPFHRFEMRS